MSKDFFSEKFFGAKVFDYDNLLAKYNRNKKVCQYEMEPQNSKTEDQSIFLLGNYNRPTIENGKPLKENQLTLSK
jgi:hypothetical protein